MKEISPYAHQQFAEIVQFGVRRQIPEPLRSNTEISTFYDELTRSVWLDLRISLLKGEGFTQTSSVNAMYPKTWWGYVKYGLRLRFPRLFGKLEVELIPKAIPYTYREYRACPWVEPLPKDKHSIFLYLFPSLGRD
jgi:hypothetical protein